MSLLAPDTSCEHCGHIHKAEKHLCWNGCWEDHCPHCGDHGHYKVWWKCALRFIRRKSNYDV